MYDIGELKRAEDIPQDNADSVESMAPSSKCAKGECEWQ